MPVLLPGTEFLYDHNIEIDRSQLRADLVYNILYKGSPHILNMELQTDKDEEMHLRLLQYHSNLHAKYKKPVISVVLYPFEENILLPPYEEMSVEEVLLTWKYWVIGLYNMEAQQFRRDHTLCMYSLLPAMKGVNADLLIQTLSDMKASYSEEKMRHHLDRFWKMLRRSITITQADRLLVEEVLKMQYDWFIDTDPEVIERVKQAEKRGEAAGVVKGEERGEGRGRLAEARQMVLDVVQARFPALLAFAQVQANMIAQPAQLRKLALELMQAPDDVTVVRLLTIHEQPA